MTKLRFDHVGLVVEDLDAAIGFFVLLGFEVEGRTTVSGEDVDRINGLDGVTAELAMLRTPDRTGRLEVIRYHSPADHVRPEAHPANRVGLRHLCLEVEELDALLATLAQRGFHPVGEPRDYVYRLVYLRGPDGLIVELAQALPKG